MNVAMHQTTTCVSSERPMIQQHRLTPNRSRVRAMLTYGACREPMKCLQQGVAAAISAIAGAARTRGLIGQILVNLNFAWSGIVAFSAMRGALDSGAARSIMWH